MSTPKKIESIEQLKEESKDAGDFFILINYGLRSSKRIWWNGTYFLVYNFIDDSEQKLTPEELYTKSNIGVAIERGACYKEEEKTD